MDDNARPHRANLVDEFLESEDIKRIPWPANSPDLNPIGELAGTTLEEPLHVDILLLEMEKLKIIKNLLITEYFSEIQYIELPLKYQKSSDISSCHDGYLLIVHRSATTRHGVDSTSYRDSPEVKYSHVASKAFSYTAKSNSCSTEYTGFTRQNKNSDMYVWFPRLMEGN
ncbi:hypothetical protein TNCV_2111581 [Trichonephila clavipes]|nr:hypothetical protein TNCV_2111581 [Trichonephila clavipes]